MKKICFPSLRICCLAGFFLAFIPAFAEESEPIELLNAGSLKKITEKSMDRTQAASDTYLLLRDEVHLKQGDIHIYSDEIYRYPDLNLLTLTGNIRIINDSVTVLCEQGSYNTDNKKLDVPGPITIYYNERVFRSGALKGDLDREIYTAYRGVDIEDSLSYSYADSVIFDENRQLASLYGNAALNDTVNQTTLRGDYLNYNLETDRFYGYENSSVYQLSRKGQKKFEIFADTLQGDVNGGWLSGHNHVYIERDSSTASADSLFYVDSLRTLQLFGSVRADYDNINLFSDHMRLTFRQGHIDTLTTRGNPKVALTDSGFYREKNGKRTEKISKVNGKELFLTFNRNDNPELLEMTGMVTSDYHVFRDSVYKGLNHMTSDTLRLFFEESDVRDIYAIFQVRGKFTPDTSYDEMDTTVIYETDEVFYEVKRDEMRVYPTADMTYGDIRLTADTMRVDWKTNILTALPGSINGKPTFIQGEDPPVRGKRFEYNLETNKGKIVQGRTKIEEGYYHGKEVIKTKTDPLYVEDAVFTTCSDETPHFHFEARQMKLLPGDRLFAKDIFFKVMDIPLLYAPSLFISIREGERLSGWKIPHFGTYPSKGWALEDFGYYWAPNDYYDGLLLIDFYDNYGIDIELRNRYAWRYHIQKGNLTLRYWNYFLSSSPREGYRMAIDHSQKIGEKGRLTVNGSFTNDSKHYENEFDKDARLQQQIVSRATYNTSFRNFSFSANASRTEDLLTGNSTTNFPQFSLSKSRSPIFERKNMSDPKRWYHNFKYSVNSSFSNKMTHLLTNADSIYSDETKNKLITTADVRYTDKLFGFLNLSPYMNYSEKWTTKYRKPIENDSGYVIVDTSGNYETEEVVGFKRRGDFNLGTTASTTVYGIFNMNIFSLKAIRHSMNASLTYNYTPDLSQNSDYIYRGTGTDSSEVVYDYFKSTLLGATPSNENENLSMRFNHKFESKMLSRKGEEKKYHFLTVTHNYNFMADSLKSSEFSASSSIRDLPGGLNLNMRANFDPYDYRVNNDGGVTRINRLRIPRMTSLSLSSDFTIKPPKNKRRSATEETQNISDTTTLEQEAERASDTEPGPGETEAAKIPDKKVERNTDQHEKKAMNSDKGFHSWSINGGLRFTRLANNPLNVENKLLLKTVFKAKLSDKWSGSYKINFDILEQKITDQYISLSRDLHCWSLSLDWDVGDSFFIRLQARGNLLKDLKLEKRSGVYY